MQQRKTKIGVVVNASMQKTVSVQVERMALDPHFHKYMRRRKKFLAHDEKGACSPGDKVEIQECRPLSRHKCWRVVRILERGPGQVKGVEV